MASIFISHRHADHEAAKKVKALMQDLNIPDDDIFLSSEARNGVQAGEPIPDVIIEKIQKSDIFLLVYTYRGEDWSYCTYELGLAIASTTKDTTVVVLSISGDTPSMIKQNKFIDLRDDSEILEFVRLCCEDDKFLIPDATSRKDDSGLIGVLKNISIDIREGKANTFSKSIQEHIREFDLEQSIKHRMDHIVLNFSTNIIEHVENNDYTREEGAYLSENAFISPESDDHAFRIFGLQNLKGGLTLNSVIEIWRKERASFLKRPLSETDDAWIDDLYMDIWRAVKGLNSRPSTNWFAGAEEDLDGRNFQLLVVRSERKYDGTMQLGMYVYRYRHLG